MQHVLLRELRVRIFEWVLADDPLYDVVTAMHQRLVSRQAVYFLPPAVAHARKLPAIDVRTKEEGVAPWYLIEPCVRYAAVAGVVRSLAFGDLPTYNGTGYWELTKPFYEPLPHYDKGGYRMAMRAIPLTFRVAGYLMAVLEGYTWSQFPFARWHPEVLLKLKLVMDIGGMDMTGYILSLVATTACREALAWLICQTKLVHYLRRGLWMDLALLYDSPLMLQYTGLVDYLAHMKGKTPLNPLTHKRLLAWIKDMGTG